MLGLPVLFGGSILQLFYYNGLGYAGAKDWYWVSQMLLFTLFGAFQLRPLPGWGWWLFDGIVTLLLAFLIFSGWPHDSVRIVALLVGISLIISGANRLALAFAR